MKAEVVALQMSAIQFSEAIRKTNNSKRSLFAMIVLLLRLTFYVVIAYVAFRLYKYVSLKVTEHMSQYDDEMSAIADDDEHLTINPFDTENMDKI